MKQRVSTAALVDALRKALSSDGLSLWYQPKVSLASRAIVRVEAIVRWHYREWGEISPAVFIPAAQRHGVIEALTTWSPQQALRQASIWRRRGVYVNVAVNVSALSLADPNLPDRIERLCLAAAVPPTSLTVEITESATQDPTALLHTVSRLRLKGVGVSLDDFGTGYSSLMQLRQLPFSELKIDRDFVLDALQSRDSRLIIQSTIDLAHGLGLTVVAEGVEDEAAAAMLEQFGCDAMQGFLVSPALKGPAIENWLLSPRGRAPDPTAAAPPAFHELIRYAYSSGRVRRLADWDSFS